MIKFERKTLKIVGEQKSSLKIFCQNQTPPRPPPPPTAGVLPPSFLSQLPDSASPMTLQAASISGGVASSHSFFTPRRPPMFATVQNDDDKGTLALATKLWPLWQGWGDRTGQAARSLPLQHWSGRFLHKDGLPATAPPAQLGATHWGRLLHFAPAKLLQNHHS